MQADAYAGFNRLYEAGRKPGPIIEAGTATGTRAEGPAECNAAMREREMPSAFIMEAA